MYFISISNKQEELKNPQFLKRSWECGKQKFIRESIHCKK